MWDLRLWTIAGVLAVVLGTWCVVWSSNRTKGPKHMAQARSIGPVPMDRYSATGVVQETSNVFVTEVNGELRFTIQGEKRTTYYRMSSDDWSTLKKV